MLDVCMRDGATEVFCGQGLMDHKMPRRETTQVGLLERQVDAGKQAAKAAEGPAKRDTKGARLQLFLLIQLFLVIFGRRGTGGRNGKRRGQESQCLGPGSKRRM